MQKLWCLFLIVSSLLSCGKKNVPPTHWLVNQGLLNVESIAYDSQNQFFYASNGKDYAPGTDGFISKISKNGKLIDLKWIDGLNRPTGMAVANDLLYVADVNSLLIINIGKGEVVKRIKEPIENAGLNDLSINKKNELYITGSFVHSVFKLKGDSLTVWLTDPERLKWANGILAEEDRVLVGGEYLNSIDIASKEITQIGGNTDAVDIDGLSGNPKNGYYISTVEGKSLFFMDNTQKISFIASGKAYYGDLCFVPEINRLLIPRGDHEKQHYFIEAIVTE